VKKKKAAEAVLSPPSAAASARHTSGSPGSNSSKQPKRALSGQPVPLIPSKALKQEDRREFILLYQDACGFFRETLTMHSAATSEGCVVGGPLDMPFLLQWGTVIKPGHAFQKPVFDPASMDGKWLSCPCSFQIGQVLRFAQEFLPPIQLGQRVVYTARCRGLKICSSITLQQLSQRIWDPSFGFLTLVVSPEVR